MATTQTSKRQQPKSEAHMAFEAYLGACGRSLPGRPSAKRMLCSFIISLVAGIGALGIGFWAAHAAAAAFFTLSGWAFISMAIWIVGQLIAAVLALYAAGRVAQYVATGQYAVDMENAGRWVMSKFDSTSTFIKRTMARESVTVH